VIDRRCQFSNPFPLVVVVVVVIIVSPFLCFPYLPPLSPPTAQPRAQLARLREVDRPVYYAPKGRISRNCVYRGTDHRMTARAQVGQVPSGGEGRRAGRCTRAVSLSFSFSLSLSLSAAIPARESPFLAGEARRRETRTYTHLAANLGAEVTARDNLKRAH